MTIINEQGDFYHQNHNLLKFKDLQSKKMVFHPYYGEKPFQKILLLTDYRAIKFLFTMQY